MDSPTQWLLLHYKVCYPLEWVLSHPVLCTSPLSHIQAACKCSQPPSGCPTWKKGAHRVRKQKMNISPVMTTEGAPFTIFVKFNPALGIAAKPNICSSCSCSCSRFWSYSRCSHRWSFSWSSACLVWPILSIRTPLSGLNVLAGGLCPYKTPFCTRVKTAIRKYT